MLQWDFSKLSTVRYETNSYKINESYQNLLIIADTADIVFVPSENLESAVVCYEQKNAKHSVAVKDGTLVIEIVDTRKWYEHIGIFFGTPKITLSVPQGEYGALCVKASTGDVNIPENFRFESVDISVSTGDVTNCASASEAIKIKATTGDIRVANVTADMLTLSVTTGDVTADTITCGNDIAVSVSTGDTKLTDVTCKNVVSKGGTGDISLRNVIAREQLSINRTTGDVKFDRCDAAQILVKTDTGDVRGSFLSEKVFIAQTDTGRVRVPRTVTGGTCQITTDTGDIVIEIV